MSSPMTATDVLSANSPRQAAARLATFLREWAEANGYNAKSIYLWSPRQTKFYGWGSGWSVCWEEGPFEWTMISAGSNIYGPAAGNYSAPGPFPQGMSQPGWLAEPYNSFVMNFGEG